METYDSNSFLSYINDSSGAILVNSDQNSRVDFESNLKFSYEKYIPGKNQESLFSKVILWTDTIPKKYSKKQILLVWINDETKIDKDNTYPVIKLNGFNDNYKKKQIEKWCKENKFKVDDDFCWTAILSMDISSAKTFISQHCYLYGKVSSENIETQSEAPSTVFEFFDRLLSKKLSISREYKSILLDNPPMRLLSTLITLTRELAQSYVILASGGKDNDLKEFFGKSLSSGKIFMIKKKLKTVQYKDLIFLLECLQKADEEIKVYWMDADYTLKKYLKMYLEKLK